MIPVENPPPPYAPARTAPSATPGTARDPLDGLRPSGPGSPRVRVYRAQFGWRGCLFAMVSALLLVAAFGGLGTCAISDVVLVDAPQNVVESIRTTARAQGREAEMSTDLDRLSAIIVERRLGVLSAGVLLNRFSDAKADTTIDERELDHLMELVHDIVVGDGQIDPASYPNGR